MKRLASSYLLLAFFGVGLISGAGLQTNAGRNRAFIIGVAIAGLGFVGDLIVQRKKNKVTDAEKTKVV